MLRRFLPKSLYARVVLIVILPIFMMQAVVTYVFFNRHWDLVTANLSANVAGQIAIVVNLFEQASTDLERKRVEQLALNDLDLNVRFEPETGIPEKDELSIFNVYNSTLDQRLSESISQPYWFNTRSWPAYIEIRVQITNGQLVFLAYRDRVFATTGPLFLFWLVGTSILLGAIAIVFMRNQVRSILKLANAAEAFGRGRDAPEYRPSGAAEVRRAGYAFIAMRERIRRHLDQRTSMLAGVSHDLRTPLTRIKLALALEPETPDVLALRRDVVDMERMVEAYLSFARNESAEEDPETFSISELLDIVAQNAKRTGRELEILPHNAISLTARRSALRRAIGNLVNNAFRHARCVQITVSTDDRTLDLSVDDDGPGIPESKIEEVFKPFVRLDEARNLSDAGVGMGLTIVKDIVRAHGGEISLGRSPLGGLRASIKLPI